MSWVRRPGHGKRPACTGWSRVPPRSPELEARDNLYGAPAERKFVELHRQVEAHPGEAGEVEAQRRAALALEAQEVVPVKRLLDALGIELDAPANDVGLGAPGTAEREMRARDEHQFASRCAP